MKARANVRSFNINIIEYLFALMLVLNCNTIWTSYEDTLLNKILKVLLAFVVVLYALVVKRISRKSMQQVFHALLLSVFYVLIYIAIVRYNVIGFLSLAIDTLCIFIFILFAAYNNRYNDILIKYENIIIVIALISLVFWIFGSTLGVLKPTGYVYSTWTGNNTIKTVPTYYNLYFETQPSAVIIRNTAIFTEAPICNFHLCIALLIELFYKDHLSTKRCLILIFAILTTLSTTGWCMLVIALFAKYIFSNNIKGFWQTVRVAVVPFALVIGSFVVMALLFNKLGSVSGSTRADDFVAGFNAWITHPLFGAGYGNSEYVKQFMSSFRSNNQGFSNSPMMILYQGGLMLGVPYIYFAWRWIKVCIKRRDMQLFIFFACFLYLFMITVVPYSFLTIFIFIASGFERKLGEIQK